MNKLLPALVVLALNVHVGASAADSTAPSAAKDSAARPGDAQPKPRIQGRPTYPKEFLAKPIGGEAVVDFIVDVDGSVIEASAVRQSHELFGQAAVAAVKKWKFTPGMKGGVPVRTHMQVPLVFQPADAKKK